jgi:hypothetical protein
MLAKSLPICEMLEGYVLDLRDFLVIGRKVIGQCAGNFHLVHMQTGAEQPQMHQSQPTSELLPKWLTDEKLGTAISEACYNRDCMI